MTLPLTVPPRQGFASFMGFPLCTDLDTLDADVAILGIPYGDPYSIDEVTNDQTNAPTAVRAQSGRLSDSFDRWDFDLYGTLFDGHDVRVVDCGDVSGDAANLKCHYRRAEAAARLILGRGALLVTIGGDHGVPIPVFRALEGHGPVTLVHIDADGFDPSVMPAVVAPAPGGLLYHQAHELIHGLVGKSRVLGMDIVEIAPARDVNGITSLTAGRLIVNLIGTAVRAEYFDRG